MNSPRIPEKRVREKSQNIPNFNTSLETSTLEIQAGLREEFFNPTTRLSADQIAEKCDLAPGSLYNAFNKNRPFKFALVKILPFCRATGGTFFLHWLASKLGYQAIKLPDEITPVSYINALNDALIALSWAQKHASEALYLKGPDHEKELALRLDWAIAGCVRLREVLRKKHAKK